MEFGLNIFIFDYDISGCLLILAALTPFPPSKIQFFMKPEYMG
jgi:hypothetical protein